MLVMSLVEAACAHGSLGMHHALPAHEVGPSSARRAARFRGLCYDRRHNAWRVRIFFHGKQRHVGRFKDDVMAARAYDKAAYFLYGHSAILNFTVEDVLADPLEVPAFIRLAKQQAAEGCGQPDGAGITFFPETHDAGIMHGQHCSSAAGPGAAVLGSGQQQQQQSIPCSSTGGGGYYAAPHCTLAPVTMTPFGCEDAWHQPGAAGAIGSSLGPAGPSGGGSLHGYQQQQHHHHHGKAGGVQQQQQPQLQGLGHTSPMLGVHGPGMAVAQAPVPAGMNIAAGCAFGASWPGPLGPPPHCSSGSNSNSSSSGIWQIHAGVAAAAPQQQHQQPQQPPPVAGSVGGACGQALTGSLPQMQLCHWQGGPFFQQQQQCAGTVHVLSAPQLQPAPGLLQACLRAPQQQQLPGAVSGPATAAGTAAAAASHDMPEGVALPAAMQPSLAAPPAAVTMAAAAPMPAPELLQQQQPQPHMLVFPPSQQQLQLQQHMAWQHELQQQPCRVHHQQARVPQAAPAPAHPGYVGAGALAAIMQDCSL